MREVRKAVHGRHSMFDDGVTQLLCLCRSVYAPQGSAVRTSRTSPRLHPSGAQGMQRSWRRGLSILQQRVCQTASPCVGFKNQHRWSSCNTTAAHVGLLFVRTSNPRIWCTVSAAAQAHGRFPGAQARCGVSRYARRRSAGAAGDAGADQCASRRQRRASLVQGAHVSLHNRFPGVRGQVLSNPLSLR